MSPYSVLVNSLYSITAAKILFLTSSANISDILAYRGPCFPNGTALDRWLRVCLPEHSGPVAGLPARVADAVLRGGETK